MKIEIKISLGQYSFKMTKFKFGDHMFVYRGYTKNHFSYARIDTGNIVGGVKDFYEIKEIRQIVRNKP